MAEFTTTGAELQRALLALTQWAPGAQQAVVQVLDGKVRLGCLRDRCSVFLPIYAPRAEGTFSGVYDLPTLAELARLAADETVPFLSDQHTLVGAGYRFDGAYFPTAAYFSDSDPSPVDLFASLGNLARVASIALTSGPGEGVLWGQEGRFSLRVPGAKIALWDSRAARPGGDVRLGAAQLAAAAGLRGMSKASRGEIRYEHRRLYLGTARDEHYSLYCDPVQEQDAPLLPPAPPEGVASCLFHTEALMGALSSVAGDADGGVDVRLSGKTMDFGSAALDGRERKGDSGAQSVRVDPGLLRAVVGCVGPRAPWRIFFAPGGLLLESAKNTDARGRRVWLEARP